MSIRIPRQSFWVALITPMSRWVSASADLILHFVYAVRSISQPISNVENLRINQCSLSYYLRTAKRTSGPHLNGMLDEVMLFTSSLSPEAVRALFAAGSAGVCKCQYPARRGLAGWWTGVISHSYGIHCTAYLRMTHIWYSSL